MAASKKPLRNWAAMDPLMRKGGAHTPAKADVRPRLDRGAALDDYLEWQADDPADSKGNNAEGPKGPSSFPAFAVTSRSHLLVTA